MKKNEKKGELKKNTVKQQEENETVTKPEYHYQKIV